MSRPATFTQPRPQPVRSKSGPAPAPTGAPKRAPVPLPRSTSGPSAVNYWSFKMIFFSHLFRNYIGKREERGTAVRFSRVSYFTRAFLPLPLASQRVGQMTLLQDTLQRTPVFLVLHSKLVKSTFCYIIFLLLPRLQQDLQHQARRRYKIVQKEPM